VIGDQPRQGIFEWRIEPFSLPGHSATETIVIEFNFPPGLDEAGRRYDGRKPKGYLPGNVQGAILLELFKVAFRRRVMFGLGQSMTTSAYRPTFNIHIKTSTHRGTTGHGYPDDDYLQRSLEELRDNGITMADLPR
jgi:deltex-like protein